MSTTITVYSSTGCQACHATRRHLDALGVTYDVVDVDAHPAARELLAAMEFTALPVVTTGTQWWSGYRPERILRAISPTPAP
jgi:glutaredoxin-like protein NrdH